MSIRMIAMDLDGTLLNRQRTITPYTGEVLQRAIDAGHLVVPATGRGIFALPPELATFRFPYLLVSSGAIVLETNTGKQLYRAEIPRETLLQCHEIVKSHELVCNYVTDKAPYMERMHQLGFLSDPTLDENDFWVSFFRYRQTIFDNFDQWIATEDPAVLKMNFYFKDMVERARVRDELSRLPDIDICSSLHGNLEITHNTATKGHGLLALANYLQISPEEIIAFGDSDNDLSMIKCAGIGVAMANSIPELLAAADRVTRSNDEDGVAWGIEQWVFKQDFEV